MSLHRNFDNRPDQGQLAKNGEWEKAVFFKPGEFQSVSDARTYVGQSGEVACEAFFSGAFFGTRRIAPSDELVTFLVDFANALGSAENGADFFQTVQNKCRVPVGINFKFAEVGAVNAWKSVGSFKIVDPAEALLQFEQLWLDLISSPVGQNETHAKAIEFAFDNGDGTTHWIACPISESTQPFNLNRDKLFETLSLFCASRDTKI